MSFVERVMIRLGIIFAMALTLRGAGAVYQIFHPVPQRTSITQIVDGSTLAAPMSDLIMQTALQVVRNSHNGDLSSGSGARMTYHSESGPVMINASYVPEINAVYHKFKAKIDGAGPEDAPASASQ